MSVEQLAIDTKIPRSSIDALEEDNFAALPGPVFVKGFLRCCARSLGIDAEPVLSLLHERERALTQLKSGGRRDRQADRQSSQSSQSPQLLGRNAAAAATRGQDTPPRPTGSRGSSAAMHAVPGETAAVTTQPSIFRFDSLTPLLSRMMSGASNSRLLMWIAVALMVAVIVVTAFVMAGGRGPGLPNS